MAIPPPPRGVRWTARILVGPMLARKVEVVASGPVVVDLRSVAAAGGRWPWSGKGVRANQSFTTRPGVGTERIRILFAEGIARVIESGAIGSRGELLSRLSGVDRIQRRRLRCDRRLVREVEAEVGLERIHRKLSVSRVPATVGIVQARKPDQEWDDPLSSILL